MKNKPKFLLSPEWKALRQQILERDLHICCLCGSEEKLCVHHMLYRKFAKEHQLNPLNLITVCTKCHFAIHKSSGNFKVMLFLRYERPEQYKFILENI